MFTFSINSYCFISQIAFLVYIDNCTGFKITKMLSNVLDKRHKTSKIVEAVFWKVFGAWEVSKRKIVLMK